MLIMQIPSTWNRNILEETGKEFYLRIQEVVGVEVLNPDEQRAVESQVDAGWKSVERNVHCEECHVEEALQNLSFKKS